jgi:hypothetical protein
MNEGYVFGDGELRFSEEKHLIDHLRGLDWEDSNGKRSKDIKSAVELMNYFYQEDMYYYTEWEEDDIEDVYYDEEGNEYEIECSIKVTGDGFVWKLITHEQAKILFPLGIFELYSLRHDDSESLISTDEELAEAIGNFETIGIEVGHLKN